MANSVNKDKATPTATPTANAAGATPQAGAANGTGTAAEVKEKKPRPERIFSSSLNLQELRRREAQVTGKFNRTARQIKAMGLSEASTNAILEILKSEFEVKAQEAINAPAGGADAAGGEQFV